MRSFTGSAIRRAPVAGVAAWSRLASYSSHGLSRLSQTVQAASSDASASANPRLNEQLWRTAAFGTDISRLTAEDAGAQNVRVRGRVAHLKAKGKLAFVTLRQPGQHTLQVVVTGADDVAVVKTWTTESVVDVTGQLVAADVKGASCACLEMHGAKFECVSKAATPLPLDEKTSKLDTRLNHRSLDLRSPFNAHVFEISSQMAAAYRDYMLSIGFREINTPKMLPTPSEGGSSVFKLKYFDREAYLAQSPQLYKQMCVMGDFPRVFEVGSVFRAENSNTHRHLTEFVGLDAEMVIHRKYTEVLDVLEGCVVHVLHHVERSLSTEVAQARALAPTGKIEGLGPIQATVPNDHPLRESLGCDEGGTVGVDKYGARVGTRALPVLRIAFDGAMQMLLDGGAISQAETDFSTAMEKALGRLAKARYGVDLVLCDRYPTAARPFYTQRDPADDTKTFSYDLLLRGEEICSGAQRLHDMKLLAERAVAAGVMLENIQPYIDCFAHGAWPHGGFGLGLQRMVMLYLGLPDVRYATLFPRDPTRVSP
jgi:aspartyl/asparaginyl-tRNA synthetase